MANVAKATPHTDIAEITFIALCDFFENRYLLAIKKGKFTMDLFNCECISRSEVYQSFQRNQVNRL